MDTQRIANRALDPSRLPPRRQQDPDERRRLSGPSLRSVFEITRAWQLTVDEARGLLGWPAPSTFHKYKSGDVGTLSYDMLTRLSLILGIYKALQVLYPEPLFADRWMKMPNTNPLFAGQPPLSLMIDDGLDGLYRVRRLLDGRRGG